MAFLKPRRLLNQLMELYINTSDSQEIEVRLNGKAFRTKAREEKSQKLLKFIDQILKKQKMKINEITKIKVNTGPGSFTGLRVGLSVANAIGWALNIPVNGKEIKKGETVDIEYE